MSPELPPELMAEILCRLPVKVRLQMRCVSKLWCSFIDSRFFIRTHLHRSVQTRKNQFLILSEISSNVVKSINLEFLEIEVDLQNPFEFLESDMRRFGRRGGVVKPRFRSLPDHLQIIVPQWQKSLYPPQVKFQVWGSCNGLVLISNSLPSTCLWNPPTRKHRILPELDLVGSSSILQRPFGFYGFGYDSSVDDYKVIKILMCENQKENQVWVYSLQSNSWAQVRKSFPPNLMKCERQPGVLVHEALHWPVKVKSVSDDDYILAFDLKMEDYRMFPQPKCQNAEFHSRLGTFNGSSLCLIYSYLPVGFEIWVMGETWTRVSLQRGDFISYPGGFIGVALRDGEDVLLHRNFLFKTSTGSTEIFRKLTYGNSDICTVSLVSTDGGAGGDQ